MLERLRSTAASLCHRRDSGKPPSPLRATTTALAHRRSHAGVSGAPSASFRQAPDKDAAGIPNSGQPAPQLCFLSRHRRHRSVPVPRRLPLFLCHAGPEPTPSPLPFSLPVDPVRVDTVRRARSTAQCCTRRTAQPHQLTPPRWPRESAAQLRGNCCVHPGSVHRMM